MTDLDVTFVPVLSLSSVVTQYWVVGLVSGWDHPRFVQNNLTSLMFTKLLDWKLLQALFFLFNDC